MRPSSRTPHLPALPRLLALALALGVLLSGTTLLPAQAADPGTTSSSTASSRSDRALFQPAARAGRTPVPGLPDGCLESSNRCEIGPQRKNAPTVVLWGDSHAWQVLAALRSAIGGRHVNVVAFLYGGCPPLAAGLRGREQVRTASGCLRTNYRALRYVRAKHRLAQQGKGPAVRVVLAAGWELYRYAGAPLAEGEPGWRQHTAPSIVSAAGLLASRTPRLFDALGRAGVPADVVGQMPTVPSNAPECAAGSRPYSCDLPRDAVLADAAANRAFVQSLRARLSGPARYIDPAQVFCSAAGCPGRFGDVATYYDDTHISPALSAQLDRPFAPTLERLLSAQRAGRR